MIEALIGMAVLSISATGLIKMHSTVVRNIATSEDISVALDIASTRADQIALMGAENAPACVGVVGCQNGGATDFLTDLLPAGGYQCTKWVNSADVPEGGNTIIAGGTQATSRYRVDAVVAAHPDAVQPQASVASISVCWQDVTGQVRQVQLSRVLVPGI